MYALQQAFRALRNNWIASVSTLTTMTLSLTILAGFSLLSLNLNLTLRDLQSDLELAAYLEEGANAPALVEQVRAWQEVTTVDLISPEEALATLERERPYVEQMNQFITNPLPFTLRIRLLDPTQTEAVATRLRSLPGVAEVDSVSDEVQTFLAINDAFRVVGSILIVVLLSAALFAIVNSIRAAITARKDEIEVMRLVGATRGFIRAPFLIEGFLLGLFSAIITLALVLPGYRFVADILTENLPFLPLERDPLALLQVAVLLAALSLLVGLVGSAISVSQYLQEDA